MDLRPEAGEISASAAVIAIEDYAHWKKLDKLADAASGLARALAARGIINGFPKGLRGGTSDELASGVRSWFENAGTDERLFLYWSGHGQREADGLYLIARDSPLSNLDQTNAVQPSFLAKSAASSKARKILIILDACFSGEAIGEVIQTISKVLSNQAPVVGSRRGVAVLASAHALQKAQAGAVCGILKEALIDSRARRRWSDSDRFIDADRLFASLEDEIERVAPDQFIQSATFGSAFELIPNPRYRPNVVPEVVEERSWRLSQSVGAEHFDLAARGIEVGESGWYFAGRRRLLHGLVDWLKTADHGLRIVTGPPGAGKSAVMGRLATLSDPEYRTAAMKAGVMPPEYEGTAPPEGIIDVAIHAKGKTLDDCGRAMAQGLKISIGKQISVDIEGLVAAITRIDHRNSRVTIMVDALDEAAGGQGNVIASRLIVPLAHLAQVRLLIGSRRSVDGTLLSQNEDRHARLREVFGPAAIIDDLEDEAETREDMAEYVRGRLTASTKHRGNPAGIAAAAEQVAASAEGVFLYARIVSRTLQELDRLDGELPATMLDAFDRDLGERFGPEVRLIDDLLGALAWGEGAGLTRRVWPLVANALATRVRSYDDEDVAWVLGHAGWHIIEAGEDGQAVYRLTHQVLADHYRRRFDAPEAQSRIVEALTQGIDGVGWLDCDRYLWRHLAGHAARADRLDALIGDPGYLAVADPARLVIVLPGICRERGCKFADIYNRVADRLIDQRPLDRLPLIHMTAQMEAPDLAPVLEPPVATGWLCLWARVRRSSPHRIIGRHSELYSEGLYSGGVWSVSFGLMDRRPVVVSGGSDETVRRWDARTGEPIGGPLEGHTDRVNTVAFGTLDGRAVVVSGSDDQTIRLWDARTGEPICNPIEGHSDRVRAVAFGTLDGRAVVVSGSGDQTIRLWNARTGKPIGRPFKGHRGAITAVAFGKLDGRAVVVSGSDDQTIRLWDARTGEPICNPIEGHSDSVRAVAFGTLDGRAVVVSGSGDQTVRLWNARTGKPIGRPFKGHRGAITTVAFGKLDGRTVVVSGSRDQTIRLWDARTRNPVGKPIEGHTDAVTAVAFGTLDSRAVVVSGSRDQTIRLWNTGTAEPIGEAFERHTARVNAVAFGTVDGRGIGVSGSDDQTIRLWDARVGEPIGKPLESHTERVSALAFGTVEGRAVVVSGSGDRTIRVWDARTGKPIGQPLKGHTVCVNAVAVGTIGGRVVVVSGSGDLLLGSDNQTIRLWDARTGKPIGNPLESRRQRVLCRLWGVRTAKPIGRRFQGHKYVNAVAFGTVDGRPVVVSGSWNLRLWDAGTGEPIGKPLEGHTDRVNTVAFGKLDGRAVVVSGSDDQTIRLWDARTGQPIGEPLEGHRSVVTSVAFGTFHGSPIVVSGSWDGTIRLWDVRTRLGRFVVRAGTKVTSIDYRSDLGILVGVDTGVLFLQIGRELDRETVEGDAHAAATADA